MRGGFRKGVGGLNPKLLSQQMKQLGISLEELTDVELVVIRTADYELVFEDAAVTVMDTQGAKMYQITGTPIKRPRAEAETEAEAAPELTISAEDVAIVMEKAGCSEEEARAALTETNGDLAEAIFRLAPQE
ncbi:MAG: nascent polypeptide-associated complex protein [Methanomicrobia archaeon]|nr:nascent polypeptide-associated complex protein [Methanomicrobia archaeon]